MNNRDWNKTFGIASQLPIFPFRWKVDAVKKYFSAIKFHLRWVSSFHSRRNLYDTFREPWLKLIDLINRNFQIRFHESSLGKLIKVLFVSFSKNIYTSPFDFMSRATRVTQGLHQSIPEQDHVGRKTLKMNLNSFH